MPSGEPTRPPRGPCSHGEAADVGEAPRVPCLDRICAFALRNAGIGIPVAGTSALSCHQELYALYFSSQEYLQAATVAYSLYCALDRSLRHSGEALPATGFAAPRRKNTPFNFPKSPPHVSRTSTLFCGASFVEMTLVPFRTCFSLLENLVLPAQPGSCFTALSSRYRSDHSLHLQLERACSFARSCRCWSSKDRPC